jgi:hypothetical protein
MGICSSKQGGGTKGRPAASPEPAQQGSSAPATAAADGDGMAGRAESQEYPRTPTSPPRASDADGEDGTPQVREQEGCRSRPQDGSWEVTACCRVSCSFSTSLLTVNLVDTIAGTHVQLH